MLRVYTVIVMLGSITLSCSAHALLERLPFIGDEFPVTVVSEDAEYLAERLEEELRTQRKESEEFKRIEQPSRAASFDRDVLEKLLRSKGYFAGRIDTRIDEKRLTHVVDPGPAYVLETLRLDLPTDVDPPDLAEFPINEGQPLQAEAVLGGESYLRDYLTKNYCLYEIDLEYAARVNHQTHQAFLRYSLQPSPQVQFARPQLIGLDSVEPDFLMQELTFSEGDCFKRREIERTRMGLLQTNLLSRVDVTVAPPENGQVVVTFEAMERSHRTLKAGLGYDSNDGFGVTAGWEHRNLLHRGQKLDIQTSIAELRKDVRGEFTVPHFWRKQQTLILHSNVARETTEAFELSKGEFGATVARPLRRNWSASLGANLEFSREEPVTANEEDTREDYSLLSFPISLNYNRSNDLLNPKHGWAVGVQTRPFIDLYSTGTRFVKTTFAASVYLTENDWPTSPTLAWRAATGTISDITRDDVPREHRYYVGGGGSVRGYGYQEVGEFDEEGVPEGGLSFSETSIELRLRFSQSWGGAIFADGGYAYPGDRPSFGDDFLWGAGFGIRYFTSFAPIRFDIATPLTERLDPETEQSIDDSVQIYISIGQAF